MSTVDQYVSRYILRKRLVEVICALAWMVDLVLIWLWWRGGHPKIGIALGVVPAACLGGFSVFLLVRRIPAVKAAMEIECRVPAFDQRLITAVSVAEVSPLVNQLLEETQAVILQSKHIPVVSIRKLIPPVIVGCSLALAHHLIYRN